MATQALAIPKDSTVLVTGLTGYIASHVAKQLFANGYKVRGTVRDLSKAAWLKDELFARENAAGRLELVEVPDLGVPGAFTSAVKGVSGIAHLATIANWDPNPDNVIPQTVQGAVSILEAAAAEPSVARVVYTSTAGTAVMPVPGVQGHIGRDSWNDVAVQAANAPPPYEATRGMMTYMASKVEAERAVWRFVEDKKPKFAVNVISPFTTLGPINHKTHLRGTAGWIDQLARGDTSQIAMLPASIYVHVDDVAALHVVGLIDPELKNERLQAWGGYYNWNDVLAVLRRAYPDRKFIDDMPDGGKLFCTTDDKLQLQLLKKWAQRDNWLDLEAAVRDTIDSIV